MGSHYKKTPKIHNKASKAPNQNGKISSTRRSPRYGSTAYRSRSISSERTRRTIEATYDDLDLLEDATKSKKYNATKRLESPTSTLEYGHFIRGRKMKKEVM